MSRKSIIRKYLSLGIMGALLIAASFQSVPARPKADDFVEKVKADVRKMGTDSGTKVVVKMKNGKKIEGHVRQVLDDSFDVTDPKTKVPNTVLYTDVVSIKKQGWSRGSKIALGIGIGAVVTVAVIVGVAAKKGLGDFCPLGCISILRP